MIRFTGRQSMIKPEALKKGDSIGIVAPAGKIDPAVLQRGIERLRQLGFEAVLGKHLKDSFRYFAGTDRQRAEDLQWMFTQDVKAIIAVRGGYGSSRLIPYLDVEKLRGSKKILIGCSDLTTLLLYFSKLGMPAFHGPMVSHFGEKEDPLSDRFFISMLTSHEPAGLFSDPGIEVFKKGVSEGELAGGCLSLLCASIGTCYEIDTEGKVLFIEEVNEPLYRIDRMLTHLRLAGKLKNIRGILLGSFVQCTPPAGADYTLKEVLQSCFEEVKCPVLSGLPFGHGDQNITLPLGIKIRLDGDKGTVTFLEAAVC